MTVSESETQVDAAEQHLTNLEEGDRFRIHNRLYRVVESEHLGTRAYLTVQKRSAGWMSEDRLEAADPSTPDDDTLAVKRDSRSGGLDERFRFKPDALSVEESDD